MPEVLGRAREGAIASLIGARNSVYRLRRPGGRRVLVYTDSRGMNVVGKLRRSGIGSYVTNLQSDYRVWPWICPEKYTTIVDFLNVVDGYDLSNFDAVVLHCGIVDFSPRPVSNLAALAAGKRGVRRFDELLAANAHYHADPMPTVYRGEQTTTVYSPDYLSQAVLPQLRAIPNLIWINSNRLVPGWDGNYHKGRPANIGEVVAGFDSILEQGLPNVVDLKAWSHAQVQELTIDNIHFTKRGMAEIARLITGQLEHLLGRP